MGNEVIKSQAAITGVQPKLSLHIKDGSKDAPQRFTVVGLWGGYILKPPTKQYAHLPEIEDVTMHLAELSGITTVPHSLIRLRSGNLAYITKRVDRNGGKKLHMEDMCQITERLTEHKYNGSHEQIAKAILKYSSAPGLDVVNYFEQVVFSFLTGNADMHLKNFSLLKDPVMGYTLCPAYDMVATALVVDNDSEELALNLNGKKRKLQRKDFITAMQLSKIPDKAIENVFKKFELTVPDWPRFIKTSFLPEKIQGSFIELIEQKANQLGFSEKNI
ncbi:MAG: HipA domain-containing protein [Chitinophagales bacterium]|nr:HipA domain-containing protein [Chitinophagales bacterium]